MKKYDDWLRVECQALRCAPFHYWCQSRVSCSRNALQGQLELEDLSWLFSSILCVSRASRWLLKSMRTITTIAVVPSKLLTEARCDGHSITDHRPRSMGCGRLWPFTNMLILPLPYNSWQPGILVYSARRSTFFSSPLYAGMLYRSVIVEHISGLLCQHNLVNGHLQTIQNSRTTRVPTLQWLQFHVLSLRLDPTRS